MKSSWVLVGLSGLFALGPAACGESSSGQDVAHDTAPDDTPSTVDVETTGDDGDAAETGVEDTSGDGDGGDDTDDSAGDTGEDGGDTGEDGGDAGGSIEFGPPLAGEVIFSELMPHPIVVPGQLGQWVELHNTASAPRDLKGCVIEGDGGAVAPFAIDTPLVVMPGGYVTVSRASDPGFTSDAVWGEGVSLSGTADSVRLLCPGAGVDDVLIDSVAYDRDAFTPDFTGASLTLDPTRLTATDNDDPRAWCLGQSIYNSNTDGPVHDLGTPGAANDACAPVYTVGACRLHAPSSVSVTEGSDSGPVYGRVFIEGLTNLTSGVDVATNVRAQLGHGPEGTHPSAWTTWSEAEPNAAWVDTAGAAPQAGWDEYQGSFQARFIGSSAYTFRFTGDGGYTWTVCELEGGGLGALTSVGVAWDHVERFASRPIEASYGDRSFVGPAGLTLSYVHGRDEGAYPIDGEGVMLRRGLEPSSLSITLPNGVGTLAVDTRKAFSGGAERSLELLVGGVSRATFSPRFGGEGVTDATVHTFYASRLDVVGPTTVLLRVTPADATDREITLDNLRWTDFP